MYYSRFTAQCSKGELAEQTFKTIALEKGYAVDKTESDTDKYRHIDFILNGNITVDVKSMKKYGYIVEIQNNWGYPGWLYGKADYIAMVSDECIRIFRRQDLVDLIESKVTDTMVYDSTDKQKAFYRLYNRSLYGWKDRFCICPDKDILALQHRIWRISGLQENKPSGY